MVEIILINNKISFIYEYYFINTSSINLKTFKYFHQIKLYFSIHRKQSLTFYQCYLFLICRIELQVLQIHMKRKESIDKGRANKDLANQLKARLFDKGFSYGTLPSVKRQVKNYNDLGPNKNTPLVITMGKSESNNKITKEQSTIFKKTSNLESHKNKFEKIEAPAIKDEDQDDRASNLTISRVPSAERMRGNSRNNSKVELRVSKSTYRILSTTGQHFSRQPTVQSIAPIKTLERIQTAKSRTNEGQMRRTRVLMDKIAGKPLIQNKQAKIQTAQNTLEVTQSQKLIKIISQPETEQIIYRPVKQLDRYIELILKNVAYIDEFIYLKKSKNYEVDPYDLEVIDYGSLKKQQKDGLKEYYTISKKGLCHYVENNPKEFIYLHNWLQERNSFDRIKSLNFFRQFRKWKTLKMWHKIIMKEKIETYSQILKERLFFLNDNLRNTILSVRSKIFQLQDLRVLTYTAQGNYNGETSYDLQQFSKIQKRNRNKIKEAIKYCSANCRQEVKIGFQKSIDILRNQNKTNYTVKPNNVPEPIPKKVQKSYGPSSKEAAYEKLKFPDNMNYQMRSRLRSECMKFLKFSYLIDFLAMSSLKNVYQSSVEELKDFLTTKINEPDIFYLRENTKQIKSTIEPLFNVTVHHQVRDIPLMFKEKIQPFMLPPSGTNTIADFKILAHVGLKSPKKEKNLKVLDDESDYEDNVIFQLPVPPKLCPLWLKLIPSVQMHYIQISSCLQQGLDILQNFERWSKHEDMSMYTDILEEWDDKISDSKTIDDKNLRPIEWIDPNTNQQDKKEIKGMLQESFKEITRFLYDIFEDYLRMHWENQQINYQLFTHEQLSDPTDSIQYTLQHLVYQKQKVTKELPYLIDKEMLRVSAFDIKNMLEPRPSEILTRIYLSIPTEIKRRANQIGKYLEESIRSLKASTANVSDFVKQMKSFKAIDKKLPKVKDKISYIGQVINILQSLRSHIVGLDKDASKTWKNYQTQLLQDMISLQNAMSKAEEGAEKNMIRFAEQVSKNLIPTLNKEITKLSSLVEQKRFLAIESDVNASIVDLESFDEQVKKFEFDAKQYAQYEVTLNMAESRFQNLQDLRASLNYRMDMWKGLRDWQILSTQWMKTNFQKIDVQEIKNHCDKYNRIVSKCTKKLPPNPVIDKLRKLLAQFNGAMPVVIALSNKSVQEDVEYWGMIQKIVGSKFVIDKEFKLQDLIEKELYVYQNQIIQISTLAKQEQILKTQIEESRSRWMKLEFTTKQYKADDPRNKDAFVLDRIDDLYAELDQLLANFSSILGNRYLKRQRIQAEELQKIIYNAMLIIDDWLIVQKNWIYLQNIFGSGDIKSKLRQQAAKFQLVDKSFKKHLSATARSKYVFKNLGSHQSWIRYKDTLSQIQKELEKYLEEKRNDFPRFYFLSNDQLIEILAKANELDSIQRNIKKSFQSVSKIIFQQDSRYIEALLSLEGETLKLTKTNINAKGQIENWLKLLEASMDQSLRRYMAKGFADFQSSKNRIDFIKNHLSQVTLVICQVYWTMDTENVLDNLQDYYKAMLRQLSELTNLIRQPSLEPALRKSLVALITQDVHNRDIVEQLMSIEAGVNKSDFVWNQQLRMYMEGQNIEAFVVARQVNAEIQYGYEYLGVMSRLVITPLTDRCWMTIIGAINIKLGASPAGPAGTGKTESTKDLAKGLGMLCIVFNCSQQIDYKMMGRLFSGLSQQGAWSCLDEFNRIDIEVLSVIAQQLLTIRVAKLKGETTFYFIDRVINLKTNCGVFITMNPGYAGRTELPDNLKVLFRSVSMMIPDYRLIAEIMLFAQGFEDAKQLSKKMVQLYKLSSEQLSQQDHYDFGMRAVKSVLVMAGSLKRADKDASEDEVLIRAMRNSNIPKFLKEDLPLFEALISDLFPRSDITETSYGQLQSELVQVSQQSKYQVVPSLTKKAIQLFETFNVRFGVMIVGQTNSGKTTCTDILAKALTSLRKKDNPNTNYRTVKRHTLNPKAISMGELYGQINEMTQQWNDGLVSSIMRQCVNEQQPHTTNWVVLDGPVDALWIENMNTVLDDNMMLCLANGERIKLTSSMRMLFQVMDLKVASPATVSRCGMVYMLSEQLTWKPYVLSWLDKWLVKMYELDEKDEYWLNELRAYLIQLFQKSIDSTHRFIAKKTKEPIHTSSIQLATSLTNLLEIMCSEEGGFKPGQDRQFKKKFLTYTYIYSFIWSACATSFDRYNQELSFHCRSLFEQVIYPNNDHVQNFYFDSAQVCFKHWNQKLPDFLYQKQTPFHTIIVETIDTIRYTYAINQLSRKLKPILITGASGTGKSIQLSRINHAPLILTSTTSHYMIQLSVESKLQKIRKNILGAAPGTITIVAIDDTNMPAQEVFGAIPAVEVLRCMIDKKGVWDRKQHFWKHIENTSLVCACSPPGGGRNELTPRFTRHFNLLCLPEPSHTTLTRIFKSILDGFFTSFQFAEVIRKSSEAVVNSTIEIYTIIKKQKLPIPSKFHYTFNLRDVSNIFQGVLECKRNTVRDVQSLGKLWFHESSRILKDRLNTESDHHWLHQKMHDLLEVNFRVRKRDSNIYFSNILRLQTREYEQINDLKKVLPIIDEYQQNHNVKSDSKLELVFFNEAVEHILRIQRILSMSRGNGLLLGVSGSGKQSLTRLASYINGYKIRQIEITKGYNLASFRQFIKSLMRECSDKNTSITFLFTDNQIIDEIFLEDINNILNSGEIPNIWEIEEREDIINVTRPFNALLKRNESPQTIYRTFVERVRQRLHVILSMSPIGNALRVRCRKFPALVSCCTIDWFFPWPEEALINVAVAILDKYQKFPVYENIPKKHDVIEAFADICKEVHISANEEARKFQAVLKRKVYTTPKSYLDMLKLYLILFDKKQNEMNEKSQRLTAGLEKLQQAGVQVKLLQKTLIKLKPQLQVQNELLEKALVQVEKDSRKAAEIQLFVSAEAEEVAKQKNQIQILTDQAKQRLKEVQPELERAKRAVESIDRKALETIRNYPKPPAIVETIMEGVCILFGIKGDWEVQKKLLIKLDDFIISLKEYKKDNIPEDRLLKLRNQLQKSEFKEEVIVKKVREMLQIAQWCKSIEKYAVVAKQIEPKKKKMHELQFKLNEANRELDQKKSVLKQAQDKVAQLQQNTKQMTNKKRQLEKELQLTKDRLQRAASLTVLTKDEAVRWKQTVEFMKGQIVNVPIDVFISTAAISYNGPFVGSYRKTLIDYWITVIGAKDLPMSIDFQISKVLGDPLLIRDWMIDGLPSDTVSLDNAIFCMQGLKWPLMIDPQEQAYKWLSKMYSTQKRTITKMTNNNFIPQMKAAVKNGHPVLLVDVEDTLPAVLDSVFSKQIKTIDNMPMIKFGEQNIYYDNHFKLFLFTKVANPNFLPEIFIRVNIINFTVTFDGLEEQLLAMVVKHERQQIQMQRDQNIVKMGGFNKRINESELNILKLLKKAKSETILDDIQLIQTLKSSQQAAEEIKQQIIQSKLIEQNIIEVRTQYTSVATRGAILFFIIKDLSLIDNMYQYSLQYIQKIFHISMDQAEKQASIVLRLENLINGITRDVFRNVTRGLFEKDKTLFAFMIAASINKASKVISEDLWTVFTRGPSITDKSVQKPNPNKNIITNKGWQLAEYLESIFPKFTGLTNSLAHKIKIWQAYIEGGKLSNPLPEDWERKLDLFDKVLLSRVLQPQKVVASMSYYVVNTIGAQYFDPPNVSIKQIWKDSDNRTPIIFVLSPGADPTASLLKFAQSSEIQSNIQIISLGQGQGGPAEALIKKSKSNGKWVLLQNCHLARTWMSSLQKLVEQNLQPTEDINPTFRLFLTSMPATYFPASVLQNGIKLTTEPPRGIKANIKRSWNDIDEQQLNACPQKSETLHKMLWGLTFFHSIIQERQKFGPLGWNIKYQFNESDLETSKTVLQMLLNRQEVVPFDALLFVTGQINYGGRVTDDWDRRCLMTILKKFYNPHILDRKYQFSKAPEYFIPQYQNLQNYRSYIDSLPFDDSTMIFGMNSNANISYLKQEQKQIMDTLLLLQPKQVMAGGKSSQDIIMDMVTNILEKKEIPELLDPQNGHKNLFQTNEKGLLPSLTTFLLQQISRFNQLLKVIKSTLEDLKKAINGFILLSDQLDSMFFDLLINKVPKNWEKKAYPSLKPFNSWMKDLKLRVNFLRDWLTDGVVLTYWMSSFFFPQGFLTGVLQQFARQPQKQIPIDQLIFSFKFTDLTKQKCLLKPAEGIYIHGLILEGASWDFAKKILIEPIKNELSTLMPIVHFLPIRYDEKKTDKLEIYQCPVYKTSVRAGVLSTTGQSTNFVLPIQIPSVEPADYWIQQGTAILLQLND